MQVALKYPMKKNKSKVEEDHEVFSARSCRRTQSPEMNCLKHRSQSKQGANSADGSMLMPFA
jgi:hypothetical protein